MCGVVTQPAQPGDFFLLLLFWVTSCNCWSLQLLWFIDYTNSHCGSAQTPWAYLLASIPVTVNRWTTPRHFRRTHGLSLPACLLCCWCSPIPSPTSHAAPHHPTYTPPQPHPTCCRMVNGIADSQQKGRVASSVNSLAEAAGLSRLLVDVRHEATHNELPSLPTLQLAARQALDWLVQQYW